MIALYLIAAHLVGDFVLQTRWQAEGKFTDETIRARHVGAYALPFIPIAVVYSDDWRHAWTFMLLLVVAHFLTDSRRFTSTLGDWIGWRLRRPVAGTLKNLDDPFDHGRPIYVALPPNPWPPISILIDQTLHVCQLAVLAGLLLS